MHPAIVGPSLSPPCLSELRHVGVGTFPAMDSRSPTPWWDQPTNNQPPTTMLHWTLVFLVIAVIAAILGFGGIAGTAAGIAKILFFVFLVLWLISFFMRRGGKP